jgi:hypothetical protein
VWTYKKIDDPIDAELFGTSSSWGLKGRPASPPDRPDVHRDGRATFHAKLVAYADLVLEPNERLLELLTDEPETEYP